jgi:hypothetical protein
LKHAANIRALKPDEFVALSVFGSELSGVQVLRTTVSIGAQPGQAPVAPTASSSKRKSKPNAAEASSEPLDLGAPTAPRPGQPAELSLADPRTGQVTTRTVLKTGKAGPQGTVLNVRVKKADVDAFAKGEMNLETFQSKAVFNSYIGNGYGILSINSWAGSSRGK